MFLMAVNKTLSNEELIKEVQEKVVALQDHEISFLNDTIANMWAAVGIGTGIIVGIAGFVGWLINRSNQKAQEKMQLAEQILGDAQVAKDDLLQYKADLEAYRKETRREFEELTQLVNSAEIADLKESTRILTTTNQMNYVIKEIDSILKNGQEFLKVFEQAGGNMKSEEVKMFRICNHKVPLFKKYSESPSETLGSAMQRLSNFVELKTECKEAVENLKQLVTSHFDILKSNEDSASS